jgi:hypothetical protein
MKKRLFFVLFALIVLPLALCLSADEYHISPSGSDTNLGTKESPWRTIQFAVDSVAPGDTVYIHAGTYTESITFSISGTPGAPINFTGLQNENVIIKGDIEIQRGTAYIAISNLTLEDFPIWGITVTGDNHHITLSELNIVGGECGIHFTYGDSGQPPVEGPVSDITLENSIIKNPLYTAVDCTPGPCNQMIFRNLEITGAGIAGESFWGADGIAIERGSTILVEGCYVYGNGGDGIDLNSRDFNGNVQGIIVRRNEVACNRRNGIKLWAGGKMENNVLWGQGDTPVAIGAYPGTYEVINNTIAYNMWNADYSGRNYSFVAAYPEDGAPAKIKLSLFNNIFAFNTGPNIGSPTGIYLGEGVTLVKEGHNLFWSREDGEIQAEFVAGDTWFSRNEISNGAWAAASGQGEGDIVADPLFIAKWPDVDLHLQENSSAIDSGTSENAPSVDCECMKRPAGNGYDIGAYEFGSTPDPECLQSQKKKKGGIIRK